MQDASEGDVSDSEVEGSGSGANKRGKYVRGVGGIKDVDAGYLALFHSCQHTGCIHMSRARKAVRQARTSVRPRVFAGG